MFTREEYIVELPTVDKATILEMLHERLIRIFMDRSQTSKKCFDTSYSIDPCEQKNIGGIEEPGIHLHVCQFGYLICQKDLGCEFPFSTPLVGG